MAALAELLSEWLGLRVTESVVQSNTVGHAGASGFQRLANQAFFAGEVERGHHYLRVDDFIGHALRDKHGRDLEDWWRERFGFGFECLTRSEARYLEKSRMLKPFEIELLQQDLKAALARLRAARAR